MIWPPFTKIESKTGLINGKQKNTNKKPNANWVF